MHKTHFVVCFLQALFRIFLYYAWISVWHIKEILLMWFDPSINFATRKIQFGKSGSGQTLDTGYSYPVSDQNIHICPSKQNNDQIGKKPKQYWPKMPRYQWRVWLCDIQIWFPTALTSASVMTMRNNIRICMYTQDHKTAMKCTIPNHVTTQLL